MKLTRIKLFLNYHVILLCFMCNLSAQDMERSKKDIFIGLNVGNFSQATFPFNNPNYFYKNTAVKVQLNYVLSVKKNFNFEFLIEPSIYFSNHQLLNEFFIQPNDGEDFLELRERFTKKRSFTEYAINLGFLVRYKISNLVSLYVLASIGPDYSAQDTERLPSGFTFSDVVGLGLSYQIKKIVLDLRWSLRHVSNAELNKPNHGYNASGFELGLSYKL